MMVGDSKQEIVRKPFVADVKRKYKAKAKKIVEFLLEMHNLYLENPGNGYTVSKKLWDRRRDKEMTWEQKMEFYMMHVT